MEKQVAETLLDTPKIVQIGGESYAMTSPSIATLVLFSRFVSEFDTAPNEAENPVAWLLKQSHKLENIGWALAVIVLGAREFHAPQKGKFSFFRDFFGKKHQTKGEILAQKINQADINEVLKIFFELLKQMRLNDFFQLTTSLTDLNLTQKTQRTEVEKTTVFGQ